MGILGCGEFFTSLMERGDLLPVIAVALGCTVGMVAIVAGSISGIVKSRVKEQTRRELAAYVAEGTIAPDDAVAILNAGKSKVDGSDGGCCT